VLGFNNHYHNQLTAAGVVEARGFLPVEPPEGLPGTLFNGLAQVESSLTCLDCHQAHISLLDGELTSYLAVEEMVFPACVKCHEEAGHGPLELGG